MSDPAKTCGGCPFFKPVPEPRALDGIRGNGGCGFIAPMSMREWGRHNEAISRDHPACSIFDLLPAKPADGLGKFMGDFE
jgi:hypothetical protein